jgi:hypothetical protein
MAQSRTHPVFQRALTQHLGPVKGLLGCNAFLKRDMAWIEASRMGVTDADLVEDILNDFDPKGGGAVQALSTGSAAWLATYSFAGPGLDLCILFFLDGISPSELQSQLELIESKIGWLTIAALMDYSEIGENAALSTEIGALVLLDAANARTLRPKFPPASRGVLGVASDLRRPSCALLVSARIPLGSCFQRLNAAFASCNPLTIRQAFCGHRAMC